MKHALYLLMLGLMAFRCGSHNPTEPTPKIPLYMEAWAEYDANSVALALRGMVFKSMHGPEPTPFDKAEVYIAEGQPANYQLLTTTTQTSLPLTNLKPGVSYYLTVKGTVGTFTSELSRPILVMANALQPTQKLLPIDRLSTYAISPTGKLAIRSFRNAQDMPQAQLVRVGGGSETLTKPDSDNPTFYVQTWTADEQAVIFEIQRARKRALVRYDVARKTYANVPLPGEADLWNYAVAPDGQQLVFTDYKRPGLWYFDARTNTQKRLDEQQTVYGLAWTADSRFALLTKPSGGMNTEQVMVQYDPQTGAQSPVVSNLPSIWQGKLSGQGLIWLQNRETRTLRPVGKGAQFGWLRDGTFWADYLPANNGPVGERESTIWLFQP